MIKMNCAWESTWESTRSSLITDVINYVEYCVWQSTLDSLTRSVNVNILGTSTYVWYSVWVRGFYD